MVDRLRTRELRTEEWFETQRRSSSMLLELYHFLNQ